MATRQNTSNIRSTGRLITALVLLAMLGMIGWTVWFLYSTLNSASLAGENGHSAATGAEELNMRLLDKIEENIADKISRPIPDPQDLRNPFVMQAEPTPEPAPAVQPEIQPEIQPTPEEPAPQP